MTATTTVGSCGVRRTPNGAGRVVSDWTTCSDPTSFCSGRSDDVEWEDGSRSITTIPLPPKGWDIRWGPRLCLVDSWIIIRFLRTEVVVGSHDRSPGRDKWCQIRTHVVVPPDSYPVGVYPDEGSYGLRVVDSCTLGGVRQCDRDVRVMVPRLLYGSFRRRPGFVQLVS